MPPMSDHFKILSIYLDGKMTRLNVSAVDELAPGRLKGLGMFETMRTVGGEAAMLEEHLQRMTRGLKLIGMKNPLSMKRWRRTIANVMKANHLREARIRLTVWKENGRRRYSVICMPLVVPSEKEYRRGWDVIVSSYRRPLTRLSRVKSTDYTIFLKAFEEAKAKGAQEAILLNCAGHVVEASRSNIFWIKKGTLFTPAVSTGCLNGIVRQRIIRLSHRNGVKVSLAKAPLKSLLAAGAIFLTNSVIGIMPVRFIK